MAGGSISGHRVSVGAMGIGIGCGVMKMTSEHNLDAKKIKFVLEITELFLDIRVASGT